MRELLGFTPESPVAALEAIYKCLPSTEKLAFRESLGIALCDANPDTFPLSAAADLVYLIGYTEARESLPALVAAIADVSDWGAHHEVLFIDALAILKGLGKSELAYETTRRICSAPKFPVHFILDAYEALVIGKPSQWASDFIDLNEQLIAMESASAPINEHSPRAWFQIRIDHVAREVLARCSLATIASGLETFELEPEMISLGAPVSVLLLALFGPEGPFIRLDEQRKFYLRSVPARKEKWSDDWDNLNYFLGDTLSDKFSEFAYEASVAEALEIKPLVESFVNTQAYRIFGKAERIYSDTATQ